MESLIYVCLQLGPYSLRHTSSVARYTTWSVNKVDWRRFVLKQHNIPIELAGYTTQKVCFLTTNYGHNKFAELQIGGHHGHLLSFTEDLFS